MPDTSTGLEQPNAAEQVNSEAGFAAALAGKGVEPDAEQANDTSIASGLETVEPGANRGPDGRFTKAEPETPAQQQDTSTDGGQPVTSDDPEVAALLAKYGGDPAAALKAAVSAQSVIGRQGTELTKTREELAELKGMFEAFRSVAALGSPAPALSDEQVEEQAGNLIQSRGSYFEAAKQAANDSLKGDSRTYDSIIEQWALESPIQAQRFDLDFIMWKRDQNAPAAGPTADPWVEDRKANEGITGTLSKIQDEIGKEAFAALVTMGDDGESPMTRALATLPEAIGTMIASPNADARLEGTRIVADRARLLSGVTEVTPTATPDPEMPESVRRKLAGSNVATAGLRPATPTPQGQESKEDAIKAFKQGILSAETTSVQSGLTFGPTPQR